MPIELKPKYYSNALSRHRPSRASHTFLLFLLFFASLACLASCAFATSSVNVPLDSWVYDALDSLEGYGLIDSALSGTKPYSRLEVGRLVAEAIRKWEDLLSRRKPSGFAEKELIPLFLERFKRQFRPELIEWGAVEGAAAATYLKPVDESISKYVFQTHNPIARPQAGSPSTYTVYPIFNNDGIVYQKYNNFSTELQGEARLWNHFSIYYRPIFRASEGEGAMVDLEKGYLKAEAFNLELEVGRDSLWWGPGYNGALLMTNNARPFDMIKLSNPQPFVVPLLGPFKFNIFLAQLDIDQPIAHPLLYGMRLNFKPHPIFEFGLNQLCAFAGEGNTALSFSDYIAILYSNRNLTGKTVTYRELSIDLSLKWANMGEIFPVARSLKLYGEAGARDTGYPPDRRAYLFGILLTDLLLKGRVDMRFEYTNTSADGQPTAWYTDPYYPPLYHDRIFGHHVGSNGLDIFGRLDIHLLPNLLLGLDFDGEIQGQKDAVSTNSYEWGADLNYWISSQMDIKGRYILESFLDPHSIAGGNAIFHIFLIEFRWHF